MIQNINFMKIQNFYAEHIFKGGTVKPWYSTTLVHCNLWQCIKGGGKSMYRIIGSFCSQIFMDTMRGWCYVGVYMCLWKCKINKMYQCSCSILSVIDSSCVLLYVAHKCHIIPAHCGWGKAAAINEHKYSRWTQMLKEYIRRFCANSHKEYTFVGTTDFGI